MRRRPCSELETLGPRGFLEANLPSAQQGSNSDPHEQVTDWSTGPGRCCGGRVRQRSMQWRTRRRRVVCAGGSCIHGCFNAFDAWADQPSWLFFTSFAASVGQRSAPQSFDKLAFYRFSGQQPRQQHELQDPEQELYTHLLHVQATVVRATSSASIVRTGHYFFFSSCCRGACVFAIKKKACTRNKNKKKQKRTSCGLA
jgi:hypothetical protein